MTEKTKIRDILDGKKRRLFPYNKNLDTLKLLISWDEFRNDLEKIRKEFDIPKNGFSGNKEIVKWEDNLGKKSDDFFDSDRCKKKEKEILLLRKTNYNKFLKAQKALNDEVPINKFNRAIEGLINKYNLPYNLLDSIKMYVRSNKTESIFLPLTSYSLSLDPKGRKNTAKWIDLRIYARLTEKEIRRAVSDLRSFQKHYLPKSLTKDIRKYKDIDKEIYIEKEMKKRIKKTKEKPGYYLKKVKEKYGQKKFERTKKLYPHRIEKEIIKYTSSEVAEKFFGNKKKAYLARQIYSRLQKKREERFKRI